MFGKKKDSKSEEKMEQKDESFAQSEAAQTQLEACKTELQGLKERYIRVSADLQNYAKRVEKEKAQWIRIAQSELLLDLLAVVDDFDRALQESKKMDVPTGCSAFVDGVAMIYKSFFKFLKKNEVAEISEMTIFDPHLHEAISQIDSPDHKSGEIVEVLQKGFMLKDKILRPAKVVVAK